MGASLHTHIEYMHNGQWVHYAAPSVERDYNLFALICGVRNDSNHIQPMVAPRGLPADMSDVTRICRERITGYGAIKGETYLTSDEFFALQKRWNELNPDKTQLETDFEWTVFRTYDPEGGAIASHKGFEDARIVFWVVD